MWEQTEDFKNDRFWKQSFLKGMKLSYVRFKNKNESKILFKTIVPENNSYQNYRVETAGVKTAKNKNIWWGRQIHWTLLPFAVVKAQFKDQLNF